MHRVFAPVLFFCLSFCGLRAAESVTDAAKKPAPTDAVAKDKPSEPVQRHLSVTISGQKIPYQVTTGKLQIKDDEGKPRASFFHVSYERSDLKELATRPIMFAFNGGPGSSAVWLHIGVLGPRIIQLPGDGTAPPLPPVRMVDNPLSILDVCDLVFIDPVSTGYSRGERRQSRGFSRA
jgi:carboxypeptidase C (cathepsin A)